jgi:hypothetical protein
MLCGSSPAGTGAQVPSEPATLQARQSLHSVAVWAQHTPSTQLPDWQYSSPEHWRATSPTDTPANAALPKALFVPVIFSVTERGPANAALNRTCSVHIPKFSKLKLVHSSSKISN